MTELTRSEVQMALEAAYDVLYALRDPVRYPTIWDEAGPGPRALALVTEVLQRWPRKEG